MCDNCDSLEQDIDAMLLEITDLESTINDLENNIAGNAVLLERGQEFEYECQDLQTVVEKLDSQISDLETVSDNISNERDEAWELHRIAENEVAALEEQWTEHLSYLEEYWPAVYTDMALRGEL